MKREKMGDLPKTEVGITIQARRKLSKLKNFLHPVLNGIVLPSS